MLTLLLQGASAPTPGVGAANAPTPGVGAFGADDWVRRIDLLYHHLASYLNAYRGTPRLQHLTLARPPLTRLLQHLELAAARVLLLGIPLASMLLRHPGSWQRQHLASQHQPLLLADMVDGVIMEVWAGWT